MFSQELEKVFNEELQITILESASMTKQVLNLTMGFNFKFDPWLMILNAWFMQGFSWSEDINLLLVTVLVYIDSTAISEVFAKQHWHQITSQQNLTLESEATGEGTL